MGGIGAAAGPLIGGLITSAISWRAAFVFQALVVAVIVVLSRRIQDPLRARSRGAPSTRLGAVLSAVGMFCVVFGILQADSDLALMAILLVVGVAFLPGSSCTCAPASAPAASALLSTALFRNRVSNLGLVTQNVQWLHAHGGLVHRRGLPADRPRLRRRPDRRHLHRGDARHPRLVARRPSASPSAAPSAR